jgi:hypothetical protein
MTSLVNKDVDSVQYQGVGMRQGKVRADAKGRISLGKFLESFPLDYDVQVDEEGKITLTPLATIPEKELWLYKNPKALKSLREGIEQAGNGEVVSRGSFAKYVDE